jgi:hypothetical protein
MQTIVKLFDSHEHAEAAVRDLETAGFGTDRLSLVRRQSDGTTASDTTTARDDDASAAGVGATIGTLVGGGAGLLAGLGMLAIPGLGPVVAAGWLVAALTTAGVGAATGGIIGALTGGGVEEADAHVYAEGVRRGGSLVTVRCEDAAEAARAESILAQHMPVSVRDRESQYRQEGWSRYEENDTMASPSVESGGLGTGAGVPPSRTGL